MTLDRGAGPVIMRAIDDLLRHLGLDAPPPPDAAGLRTVHRAFVATVPFDNLTVQLGESAPLDPPALIDRVLSGRGGYCFEVNTVLHELLVALGFRVERREAIVGPRHAHAAGEPTNHLTLVVDTPQGRFVADGGLGMELVDPMPLAEGRVRAGAFEATLERDGDGWWVGLHEWAGAPGFRFADPPAELEDFAPHHERLSTSPDSGFVRTLVVQHPTEDRIVTLRARTFTVAGPGREEERHVVADQAAFTAVLEECFRIPRAALGPQRLARLWERAVAQHEAHVAAA